MPSTCQQTNKTQQTQVNQVNQPKITLPNFLLFAHGPEYSALIKRLIHFSMQNLSRDYFNGQDVNGVLTNINRELHHSTVDAHLLLFFLLLNVDTDLKYVILEHEHISIQRKLVRFFEDLKTELVPKLFTDDRITPSEFVSQCRDLYIIS